MTKPTGNRPSRAEPILRVTAAQWGAWLADHHASATGALVMITKGTGRPALSYAEALDVALAWGWIDGQKRAHDDRAWLQRFSPRRPRSAWSKINRDKAEALTRAGKMRPPGLQEVERARQDGRWDAAYDSARTSQVPDDLARALAGSKAAAAFFETLDSANRYAILYRCRPPRSPRPARRGSPSSWRCWRTTRRCIRPGASGQGPRDVDRHGRPLLAQPRRGADAPPRFW